MAVNMEAKFLYAWKMWSIYNIICVFIPSCKTPISGGKFLLYNICFALLWHCNSLPWVLMYSSIHIHTLHYLPWEALNSNWFVAYTDKTQLVCPSAEWVQTRSLFLPENFSFFTCPLLYGWENLYEQEL